MTDEPRLATAADVGGIEAAIGAAASVAIDTEFHTERTWAPELMLVQVGLPDGAVWLLDPQDARLMSRVGPRLAAARAWILHGGAQDVRVLADALGAVPPVVYDTQVLAGLIDNEHPAGLARLLGRYLDVHLDKRATLSDWSRRPLLPLQLRYAAADVEWLHALHAALAARVEERGRTWIADAACAQAREEALTSPDPATLLRRLGNTPSDPIEHGTLQALVAWREDLARSEDRPARSLIGDAALRQLAQLQPDTLQEILDQRRLPRSFIRTHGEALLQAIRSGRAHPPPPRAATARPLLATLRLVLDVAGRQEAFAPNLVLPPTMLDDLASDPPTSRAALRQRIGPWRDAMAGRWVDAALNGKLTVNVDRGSTSILVDENS